LTNDADDIIALSDMGYKIASDAGSLTLLQVGVLFRTKARHMKERAKNGNI